VKDFYALGKIISIGKNINMFPKLFMGLIRMAINSGFFKCTLHTFNLTVRPRAAGFGKPAFNIILPAYALKGMITELRRRA
jgi:hypothetical protein